MKNLSLRFRLILLISLVILLAWSIASSVTYFQIRYNLQAVLDSQQLLFAKRLASPDLGNLFIEKKSVNLPKVKSKAIKSLEYDDDALAFAIFNLKGDMLLNDGESGKKIKYNPDIINSKDGVLISKVKDWHILWLRSFDDSFIVAVGQEDDYREDLIQQLIVGQMIPWLIMLPLLMILIIIMVSRELKPLQAVAAKLRQRKPDDSSEIGLDGAPKEVQPFIDALNALFVRISGMLIKERRFISDAAHELRTPLAALKVQTEVVQLSDDDPQSRHHALNNLAMGIDRATRLVDQLLTLSRLDAYAALPDVEKINWPELVESVIGNLYYQANQKGSEIRFTRKGEPDNYQGNVLLLSLLISNLIDNALRYTPEGSSIDITLHDNKLMIEDNGPGVSEALISRLGERFFRPPGQDEIGSGLGLSIVKQIADFHRMKVHFYNKPQRGLVVEISW